MTQVGTERVLVVPTAVFHELGHFQGFTADVQRYVAPLLDSPALSYRPREEMEEDPGFKQLIPYVIFRHQAPTGEPRVFQYQRGTGQGEGRLHRLRSVGVGGHISSVDSEAALDGQVYQEGMRRELAEEVVINTPYQDRCVGLINDDETAVGRVHLGVVHVCDVERPDVSSREEDLLDAGFRPVQEILRDLDQFETWSQIAMRALFGGG